MFSVGKPLIDQGGNTHPGRVVVSAPVIKRDGASCVASAASLLKLSRRLHTTPDPVRTAARVHAYLRQPQLSLYDRIVVLLFWGRKKYTSLLKPVRSCRRRALTLGGGPNPARARHRST